MSIKIYDNVETIDNYAFYKCSKLKTIDINAANSKITLIDNGAFSGCAAIEDSMLLIEFRVSVRRRSRTARV